MNAAVIRDETERDQQAIFDLTQAAFATVDYASGTEGHIINALRRDGDLTLSLVLECEGALLGHIAFSPAELSEGAWYALGPISVAPDYQRKGVGSKLIKAGLVALRARGADGCVLIGDPNYYGRFGFVSDAGLNNQDVPQQYVQGLRFDGGTAQGEIRFAPGFDAKA